MRKKSIRPLKGARFHEPQGNAQILWHGVSVESSGSSADELEAMLEFVGAIAPVNRALIDRIYCYSDVGHCSVHLRRGDQTAVRKMGDKCAAILLSHFGSIRSFSVEVGRLF